jgi:hypothetical protein
VTRGTGSEPIGENRSVAGREIAEIYSKLREQALGFGSIEIKAPPVVAGGRALGVIMDLGYETAVVSVMGLADGTVSMYISNGGGTLGVGNHEPAAAASKRWVEVAETAPELVETEHDSLPAPGRVRFNVLTTGLRLEAEASEEALASGSHPLSALYVAGQEVITEIRLVDEARAAENR